MAGTGGGGRRNASLGVKAKNATADRAALIKGLRDYYRQKKKKHGATGVGLNFSMNTKKGYAGLYTYAKGGRQAQITIMVPSAQQWADSENAAKGSLRITPTTALAEGKKIINAELAHHVDVMENYGGKGTGKLTFFGVTIKKGRDAHGESYQEASRKVGPRPGGIRRNPGPPRKRLGSTRMAGNA